MNVLGPVSQPISPLAATSPVRGSQTSSLTENGVGVCFSSRSRADVGSGVNAIESSAKKSRNESRMPFVFAVFAKSRSVFAIAWSVGGMASCAVTNGVTTSESMHAATDFGLIMWISLRRQFAVFPPSVSGLLNFSRRLTYLAYNAGLTDG